eukprot:1057-Heterococcus_DN1.PRE.1
MFLCAAALVQLVMLRSACSMCSVFMHELMRDLCSLPRVCSCIIHSMQRQQQQQQQSSMRYNSHHNNVYMPQGSSSSSGNGSDGRASSLQHQQLQHTLYGGAPPGATSVRPGDDYDLVEMLDVYAQAHGAHALESTRDAAYCSARCLVTNDCLHANTLQRLHCIGQLSHRQRSLFQPFNTAQVTPTLNHSSIERIAHFITQEINEGHTARGGLYSVPLTHPNVYSRSSGATGATATAGGGHQGRGWAGLPGFQQRYEVGGTSSSNTNTNGTATDQQQHDGSMLTQRQLQQQQQHQQLYQHLHDTSLGRQQQCSLWWSDTCAELIRGLLLGSL